MPVSVYLSIEVGVCPSDVPVYMIHPCRALLVVSVGSRCGGGGGSRGGRRTRSDSGGIGRVGIGGTREDRGGTSHGARERWGRGKRDRNHNRDRVATTTGFTHLSRRVRVTARVQVMMRVEMQM